MNILITGGAGFIGSHIADLYSEEGHRVVVVDNLSTGFEKNLNPKVVFYKHDILDDEIDKIIEKEQIDCISHHAAQKDVRVSVSDPRFDCKVNIEGSLNLLQAAVSHKVKKFIFASTGGAIYGEQESFPADESHSLNPLSPYGISKLCVEKYLAFYALTYGLSFTALRYANVYGPRQDPHGEAGVVAIFAQKLLRNESCAINGDGEQTRDYTCVADVAKANLLALSDKMSGCYNVGTGKETSVNELYETLAQAVKSTRKPDYLPAKKGEQKRSVLSFDKISTSFGWSPGISLDEGIKLTIDYFTQTK